MRKMVFIILVVIFSATFFVNNVEAAKKDKIKPTVKLVKKENNWTKKSVKIAVSAKDKSGIKKILWKSGKIKKAKASYWYGAKNIKKKKYFKASTNGWYSVKVIDKKGNFKISRIKISNIDKQGPTARLNYTVNNKIATVKVSSVDPRGVNALRWSYGYITSKSVAQFSNVINSNTFTANRNGYYTVWAKDSLGNISLGYIYVELWKNLTSFTPFDRHMAGVYEGTVFDRWENIYSNPIGIQPHESNGNYIEYFVAGQYQYLEGSVFRGKGLNDDEIVWLEIYVDDVLIYTSDKMNYKSEAVKFKVNIGKGRYIKIIGYTSERDIWGYSYNSSKSDAIYITGAQLYN